MLCDEFERLLNELLDEGRPPAQAMEQPEAAEHRAMCPSCARLYAGYQALAVGLRGLAAATTTGPDASRPAAAAVSAGLPAAPVSEPAFRSSWTQPTLGLLVMTALLAIVGWLVHTSNRGPTETLDGSPRRPIAADVAEASDSDGLPLAGQAAVRRFLTQEAPEIAADLVQPVVPISKATRRSLDAFFSAVLRAVEQEDGSSEMTPRMMEQETGSVSKHRS